MAALSSQQDCISLALRAPYGTLHSERGVLSEFRAARTCASYWFDKWPRTIARPIPQSHINKLINDKVDKLNTDIVTKDCPKHTKMILGPNHNKIINNLNRSFITNRKDYRTATQLITGHCGLNKHLYNMNKTTTKECPLCGHLVGLQPTVIASRAPHLLLE